MLLQNEYVIIVGLNGLKNGLNQQNQRELF